MKHRLGPAPPGLSGPRCSHRQVARAIAHRSDRVGGRPASLVASIRDALTNRILKETAQHKTGSAGIDVLRQPAINAIHNTNF